MIIDLDMPTLSELVRVFDDHGQINHNDNATESKGLFVSNCTDALSCVVERLASCLNSPIDCDVIGKGLVREVLYHVLKGPQVAPLFALVSHNTHLSRMERVLKHLHSNFQNHLDVEQLAGMANMSPSTFHRNFKQITASSPIQYVKKIRLSRARELLLDQGLKVKQAAAQVGYESSTQFSREFTRYFGQSPSQCN
jgi:AraC-like DNA-binding protein